MNKTRIAISTLFLTAALTLTGCGSMVSEPFNDAEVGNRNDAAADVISMPDGFSNVASKCDHGNRVYTIYHATQAYGSVAVVPQDPTCGSAQ